MRAFLLREGSRVRIVTPYVPEFVADLKSEIPYYARDFDRDSKHWIVDGDFEEAVCEIVERYFETSVVILEAEALKREQAARHAASQAAPPRTEPSHDSAECARRVRSVWREEAELFLLPGAPLAVVRAAFRELAKLRHPDLNGGDGHEAMVRLSRAYELLQQRARGGRA